MNNFTITKNMEGVDSPSCNIFFEIAKVIQKDYQLRDIWEDEYCVKGFEFNNITLTYDDGVIELTIEHDSMSVDRQFEIYKNCLGVVLEYKGVI